MCKCTPELRTPWCGKAGCEYPKQEEQKTRSRVRYSVLEIIHALESAPQEDSSGSRMISPSPSLEGDEATRKDALSVSRTDIAEIAKKIYPEASIIFREFGLQATIEMVLYRVYPPRTDAPQSEAVEADRQAALEWVNIQIEHHENQISELKPMAIYLYDREYKRLKVIRAALARQEAEAAATEQEDKAS